MLYALLTRTSSHLSVLHVRAPLFTQTAEGGVRNGYTLRFSNKLSDVERFHPRSRWRKGRSDDQRDGEAARRRPPTVRVDPDSTLEVPVYVTSPSGCDAGQVDADHLHATDAKTGERSVVVDNFFGP